MTFRAAALVLAALAGACAFRTNGDGGCVPDGGRVGRWTVVSTGFGCVEKDGEGFRASTSRSGSPSETHAFLITGPRATAPFTLSATLETVAQNRAGAPNDWEAAWLVWGYADRKHFYYFVAKPDGWELGKRDPAFRGGQRFLTDGKEPAFPLGRAAKIAVVQNSEHRIFVYADGKLVTAFTDVQRPYEGGRIGLYGEDCAARFGGVSVSRGD